MPPRPVLAAVAGAAVLALAAACGSSSGSPAPADSTALSGSITVYAASSLTGAFTTLGTQFEDAHPGTTVTFSYGASSTLAQQILAGAPVDVFASASTTNMQQVADDVTDPMNFASNTAELAVAPDKAASITSIDDLGNDGVTFAVCAPQVPCGALAQTVLGKAGVTASAKTQGTDVKSTLAYVTNGQVDAAVVYVTDVKAAGSSVAGVTIPAEDNSFTDYPIAVTKASKNSALADAFEQYVLSGLGTTVLQGAGFSSPQS